MAAGEPKQGSSGAIFDPTQNVLDLVRAESKYQDDMRREQEKLFNAKMRAETRRINELAAQRRGYQIIIAEMQKEAVQTTSHLLSTQLANFQNASDRRLSELERFRYESGGKWSGLTNLFTVVAAVAALVAIYMSVKGGP